MQVSWDDAEGEHEGTADLYCVDALLGALDGEHRTHVSIGDADAHLVCGGSAGQGVVLYAQVGGEIHQVVSDGGDEPVELVAAGQPGVFPSRLVVDIDTARRAARTFVTDSKLEPSVPWERQG